MQRFSTRMKQLLLHLFLLTGTFTFASQWTQRADFGGVGRHRTTGLSIGNRIYLGLGHSNGTGVETYFSDWWEYDPSTNAWTQKVDYPGNNGNGELGAHGIGLELVGYVGLGELDDYALYKYDPSLNNWTQMSSPITSGTFQDTGDFTIGHKAYFTRLNTSQLWEYDADIDSWSQKNALPFTTYFSWSGFSLDGKGYLKISNSALTVNQLWEYDPILDAWQQKTPFPGYARLSSVSFVQYGKAYIVCGYGAGNHSDLTSEVWEYNPLIDTWSQLEDFPGTSRRYSTGISMGDKCFLGTGTNGTNFNDFWEFDALASLNEKEHTKIMVYPNPTDDYIVLEKAKRAVLLDLNGKKIMDLEEGYNDLKNTEGGIYFVNSGNSSTQIIVE